MYKTQKAKEEKVYTGCMKIHVYSTLARLVVKEEKKETQTQYTTSEQYKHKTSRTPGCPALRAGMVG